jgi:serpin B
MKSRFVFMIVSLVFIASCKPQNSSVSVPKSNPENQKKLIEGENAFACDLYRKLAQKEGNLFFSPVSVSTALTMTHIGASDTTADQMAKVLHLPPLGNRLHQENHARLYEWNQASSGNRYTLSIANALWGQEGKQWEPVFQSTIENHYAKGFHAIDFAQPESARKKVNQWVKEQTREKIPELLPDGAISNLTRLILTNAIYFKSNWAFAFKPQGTETIAFYPEPDKPVKTPIMFQTFEFGYYSSDQFAVLELPYVGKELSMIVLLPHSGPLAKIESQLNADQLQKSFSSLKKHEVNVGLPKFKIESDFRLKEPLVSLGMKDAFDSNQANFSGMDGTRDLFIGDVYHKAFIEVGEEGTEAAGSTGVVMIPKSEPGGPSGPSIIRFHAVRPFLFFIRDNSSGSILFMGRITDPSKKRTDQE